MTLETPGAPGWGDNPDGRPGVSVFHHGIMDTINKPAAAPAIDPDYSINRLVIGMWEDAIRQARKGDTRARYWLYNEGVLWIDIIMDIHTDHTRRYLDRIFKPLGKRKATQRPQDERKRRKATTDPTLQPAA